MIIMRVFLFFISAVLLLAAGTSRADTPAPTANTNPAPEIKISVKFADLPNDLAESLFGLGVTELANDSAPEVSGVFTPKEYEDLMRRMVQTKQCDIVSDPSMTTESGKRVIAQIVREFRYPSDGVYGKYQPSGDATPPAIPATAAGVDMRPTGITVEVEPTVRSDGLMNIWLAPRIVEFLGFLDYGNKIPGAPIIKTPVFGERRATTSIVLQSGQTALVCAMDGPNATRIMDTVSTSPKAPPTPGKSTARTLFVFVTAELIPSEKTR